MVHWNYMENVTVFKELENTKFVFKKEKLLQWLCKEAEKSLPKGFPEPRVPVRHRRQLGDAQGP